MELSPNLNAFSSIMKPNVYVNCYLVCHLSWLNFDDDCQQFFSFHSARTLKTVIKLVF